MKHDADEPPAANVSRETLSRLDAFAALLTAWSKTVNLVARGDLSVLRERHIADSLQLLPLLAAAPGVAIDLGSGAGFPGLVLAIAAQRPFHLVESDQRKAAFLREAARLCGAPVSVHASRIEDVVLPPAGLITARALAPLPQLLRLAAPLLAPGGRCLFLKGATAEAELTQAAAEWQMHCRRWRSHTAPGAVILEISELARDAA